MKARQEGNRGSSDPFATEPSQDPFANEGSPRSEQFSDPFSYTTTRYSLNVGGRSVLVELPGDYCQLDRSRPDDRRVLEASRTATAPQKLYGIYVPCHTLDKWHSGDLPTLPRYSLVSTTDTFASTDFTASRSSILNLIAENYDNTTVSRAAEQATNAFNAEGSAVAISDTRVLGLLERNDDAVFVGSLVALRTEFGTRKNMVSIVSLTVISNRVLYMTHFRNFDGKEDLDNALSFAKDWMRRTVRANAAL